VCLLVCAVLGVLASVVLYGVMSYRERGIFIQLSVGDANGVTMATTTAVALIEWGYYVAAAGAVVSLLAAVVFFCDGRRSSADAGGRYETAATIEM